MADYMRKGFLRGRSMIIREPLAGQRAVCPVSADTAVALSSPRRTLDGILCAATVDDARWGSRSALNLPALTTTPREMAASLDRVAGSGTSDLIEWAEDPVVASMVATWPAHIETPRARGLGLKADESFDDIVRAYIADNRIVRA